MTHRGHAQTIRRRRCEVLLQRCKTCLALPLKLIRSHVDEIRAFVLPARYPFEVNTEASGEPDSLIGQPLFGSYVITRRIGHGGMGVVYAVESQELGKTLAMKVLRGDAAKLSPTTTARFVAEARAASSINHRNIIDVIDSAQLPDGRRYILMEYLEGMTLREFAKGIGPLSIEVALAVLAQICSGLQAAHDRGIIHRDLKPSNIIISPQPDNPYFAKILDFGIAKLSDPALGSEVETQTNALAGTPSYMAPEQARALRDVDQRTDIYALGVMAYRLFCGKLPYKAHSIGELVHQQTTTSPESLELRRGDLPHAWTVLVHRAMAMDPAQRPQSANEFAAMMIAATPGGEEIAKRSASLLFTTETGGSFSTSQTGDAQRAQEWSQVSMPDGTQQAPTQSRSHTLGIIGIVLLLGLAGFLTFLVLRNRATDSASPAPVPPAATEPAATEPAATAPEPVVTPIVVSLPDAAPLAETTSPVDAAPAADAKKRRKTPKGKPPKGKTPKGTPDKGNAKDDDDLFDLRK